MKAFFISIPHSGEKIPPEALWLKGLSEPHLMRDVDRYVDILYKPVIDMMSLPAIVAQWHRYAADLNRTKLDIDQQSVNGAKKPKGAHPTGLHWSVTTMGEVLMESPISMELHELLVKNYHEPWHEMVASTYQDFFARGAKKVFQLDCHSMPSKGTDKHRDPGETRSQVVISDQEGKSCESEYKDLVISAYEEAGFQVAYNWPYLGGGVTQTYGCPAKGQNCIQVELNRNLYMNEKSKKLLPQAENLKSQLTAAVQKIYSELPP